MIYTLGIPEDTVEVAGESANDHVRYTNLLQRFDDRHRCLFNGHSMHELFAGILLAGTQYLFAIQYIRQRRNLF